MIEDQDGDYFNPEDFEPYEQNEQDIINNAFNILKSKGVTPNMYEELWKNIWYFKRTILIGKEEEEWR